MRKARGITLVELLIALTIAAILLALGAPSFKRLLQSNNMSSGVNTFLSDARFARSEGVRLGGKVIVCRSDDPEAAAPVCAADASNGGGKGWATGWVVFHDKDGDDGIDAGEILRVQAPISALDSILEDPSTATTKLKFTATGRMQAATGTKLDFGGDNYETSIKRVVCIGASGRARIAGPGGTSC
jgi:type IV fimbrial biogenesis protein FimT